MIELKTINWLPPGSGRLFTGWKRIAVDGKSRFSFPEPVGAVFVGSDQFAAFVQSLLLPNPVQMKLTVAGANRVSRCSSCNATRRGFLIFWIGLVWGRNSERSQRDHEKNAMEQNLLGKGVGGYFRKTSHTIVSGARGGRKRKTHEIPSRSGQFTCFR